MNQRRWTRKEVVGNELREGAWLGNGGDHKEYGGHWTPGYLNVTVYLCSTLQL